MKAQLTDKPKKRSNSKSSIPKKKIKPHASIRLPPSENATDDDIIKIFANSKKSKENTETLANYCKKNERLMAILQQNTNDNSLNKDIFIQNLAGEFDYTFCPENSALFNYGDIGDKFYVIIKGEVAILIPQEKQISLSYFEYVAYLCNLSRYKEIGIMHKCIEMNNSIFNVSLELIEKVIRSEMEEDENFKKGIVTVHQHQPNDYERCISESDEAGISRMPSLRRKGSFRRMSKKVFLKKMKENQSDNKLKIVSIKDYLSLFDSPEKYTIEANRMLHHLQVSIKSLNLFQKLVSSTIGIAKRTTVSKFSISSSDSYSLNEKSKLMMSEEELQKHQTEKQTVRIFKFINVKLLKNGDIFGDIALQNNKNKRTATIFVTQPSHFLFLIKQSFDYTIGAIHSRIINEKMKFLKTFSLFQYYPAQLLYENYYRFFTTIKVCAGNKIFEQGKQINTTYFIRKGNFRVYILASLFQIYEYLQAKGFESDLYNQIHFHNSNNGIFNKFIHNKQKFTISVLGHGEFAGLDYVYLDTDTSIVNIECVSDTAELFMLENYDFFRLLNDYSNWKFSILSKDQKDPNAQNVVVMKQEKDQSSKSAHQVELQKATDEEGNNPDKEEVNETKIGNFQDTFDYKYPKNPIHIDFMNYVKTKEQSINERLKQILKISLYLFVSKESENIIGNDIDIDKLTALPKIEPVHSSQKLSAKDISVAQSFNSVSRTKSVKFKTNKTLNSIKTSFIQEYKVKASKRQLIDGSSMKFKLKRFSNDFTIKKEKEQSDNTISQAAQGEIECQNDISDNDSHIKRKDHTPKMSNMRKSMSLLREQANDTEEEFKETTRRNNMILIADVKSKPKRSTIDVETQMNIILSDEAKHNDNEEENEDFSKSRNLNAFSNLVEDNNLEVKKRMETTKAIANIKFAESCANLQNLIKSKSTKIIKGKHETKPKEKIVILENIEITQINELSRIKDCSIKPSIKKSNLVLNLKNLKDSTNFHKTDRLPIKEDKAIEVNEEFQQSFYSIPKNKNTNSSRDLRSTFHSIKQYQDPNINSYYGQFNSSSSFAKTARTTFQNIHQKEIDYKINSFSVKGYSNLNTNECQFLGDLKKQSKKDLKLIFTYSRNNLMNQANSFVKARFQQQLQNLQFRKKKELYY